MNTCWKKIVLVLLLFISTQLQAAVTASVDRSAISLQDTLTLVLSNDGGDAEPDLSPLQQDFEVLGTSTSSNFSFINGRSSSSKKWQVSLLPKRAGQLTIPAISFAGEKTRPITVTVSQQPPQQPGLAQKIFIRSQVDQQQPYVQASVNYTVQLYLHGQMGQVSGELLEPAIEDARVSRLGEDRQYRTLVDGVAFQVIERQYRITPEKSGRLVIPAIEFRGEVPDKQQRRSSPFQGFSGGVFDSMFQSRKRVRVLGEETVLDVQSRPAGFTGTTWLPAQSLHLTAEWETDNLEFVVGEPIMRRVVIHALGLDASQLPDLQFKDGKNFKLYPDKPVSENNHTPAGAEARKTIKLAIVPSAPGWLTLPEIRLDWWDLGNNRQRTAVIPAFTTEVTGQAGPTMAMTPPVEAPVKPPVHELQDNEAGIQTPVSGSTTAAPSQAVTSWQILSLGLFILWLVTLIFLLRARRPAAQADATPAISTASATTRLKQVRQAIKANDMPQLKQAIIAWGQANWNDAGLRTLVAVAEQVHAPGLHDWLLQFDRQLYTANDTAMATGELLTMLQEEMHDGTRKKTEDALPSLYPAR